MSCSHWDCKQNESWMDAESLKIHLKRRRVPLWTVISRRVLQIPFLTFINFLNLNCTGHEFSPKCCTVEIWVTHITHSNHRKFILELKLLPIVFHPGYVIFLSSSFVVTFLRVRYDTQGFRVCDSKHLVSRHRASFFTTISPGVRTGAEVIVFFDGGNVTGENSGGAHRSLKKKQMFSYLRPSPLLTPFFNV